MLFTRDDSVSSGAATSLTLFAARLIAIDGSNSFYFHDAGCIFKVSNGVWTKALTGRTPGVPSNYFTGVGGLTASPTGDVYISDLTPGVWLLSGAA